MLVTRPFRQFALLQRAIRRGSASTTRPACSVLAYFASSLVMIPLNRERNAFGACFQCAHGAAARADGALLTARGGALRLPRRAFTLSGFRRAGCPPTTSSCSPPRSSASTRQPRRRPPRALARAAPRRRVRARSCSGRTTARGAGQRSHRARRLRLSSSTARRQQADGASPARAVGGDRAAPVPALATLLRLRSLHDRARGR